MPNGILTEYLAEAGQVLIAAVVGAIIGLEREFRSKPAGFRTMILICVGSCLFTILSKELNTESPDRIASNIVTGIGFIGAGVIFKSGLSVSGLTTAALIWVTAALGMAIGFHNYPMTILVSAMVVFTLFVLEPVQRYLNKLIRAKTYRISILNYNTTVNEIETFLKDNQLDFKNIKIEKQNFEVIVWYRVSSPDKAFDKFEEFLLSQPDIKSFEA